MHRHLRPSARKSRISRTGMSSERDQCRNNHQISHRLTPVRTKSPARDLHGVRGDPVVIEGHARDHPARSRTQRGALEIRSPNDSIAFRDARSWRRRRHYVPESKIDARRHSRGHLRHLVPPEALGLAGHDKPVPILRLTVNVCFVRLCRSRNRRAAPSDRLGHCRPRDRRSFAIPTKLRRSDQH